MCSNKAELGGAGIVHSTEASHKGYEGCRPRSCGRHSCFSLMRVRLLVLQRCMWASNCCPVAHAGPAGRSSPLWSF